MQTSFSLRRTRSEDNPGKGDIHTAHQMIAEFLTQTDGHSRTRTMVFDGFAACNSDALVREGSTVFRRRSIRFLLQYFTAVPKKRVNSPSMISRTKASHLCIIFFSSITIILTDSRADDKSISSLTTMIQGSCSVFERQRYLIVGITLYL